MLITCPNCATSYDVSAASLGAEGRSVRCVRCHEVWFATPTAAAAGPEGFAGAAASAYRHGAASVSPEAEPDAPIDDFAAVDGAADIDANLAARAADRAHVEYDGPSALGDAAGLDAHDSPPLAPGPGDAAGAAARAAGEDIESIAARRARREVVGTGHRRLRPSLTMVIGVLIAVNGVLLGWRTDVVRLMPQTAPLFAAIGLPVNLRGLAFDDVTTSIEMSENVPVLLVKGKITNISRVPRDVTRLRFAMRTKGGNEVYAWTSLPARAVLAPGESEPFETRLASPPADGQSVVVRFFTRRDLVAGAH